MTDREIMQQALDALKLIDEAMPFPVAKLTIKNLRDRLAQPQMQPCAGRNCGSTNPNLHSAECFEDYEKSTGMAQPVAPKCGAIIEVFGKDWRLDYMSLPVGKHKLYTQQYTYTAPAQRKPLTEEEIERACVPLGAAMLSFTEVARAIEAAHGIKENT
jgi:hypothetical protein